MHGKNFVKKWLLLKYKEIVVSLGLSVTNYDAKQLKDLLVWKSVVESLPTKVDLISFWQKHMSKISNKNSLQGYISALNRLRTFIHPKDVLYTDSITISFIEEYERFLRTLNWGARSINLYMTLFKAVFNAAKREEN